MYYSDDLVEQVRSASNIVDIIGTYVHLQKKGNSYFGLCPFHNEKTPSFSVSPDKQMYYCFGCGAGGNVFTFLMEYENYTFAEAMQYLAERAGISLPEPDQSPNARKEADRKAKLLEINKEAAVYFAKLLYAERGRTGLNYLKERGLTAETLKKFGLGYSDKYSDDLYQYLKQKGYSDELLTESGLFTYSEKYGIQDKFWNRVMFPIMDINQKVIAFGGRVMGDAKPKYLNSPETRIFDKSRNLYGLHLAKRTKSRFMILCEGYMDVIACHEAGFDMAVASLGTAFTQGQAQLLKRYTQSVCIIFDSDAAGTKAALRALPMLRAAGIDGKVVRLDPCKDPDEFIRQFGKDAFMERLNTAENGFLFKIRMLESEYDMRSPEGRTRFYNRTAKELLIFEDNLERMNYVQAVAERYQIRAADLNRLVNQAAMKSGIRTDVPREETSEEVKRPDGRRRVKADDAALEAQRLLLTWMADDDELGRTIRKYVYPGDFSGELYGKVAELLYAQAEAGELKPGAIVSRFDDEKDQKEVAAIFHARLKNESDREQARKAVKEVILRVKRARVDLLASNLNPTDLEAMQELIKSRQALQKLEQMKQL